MHALFENFESGLGQIMRRDFTAGLFLAAFGLAYAAYALWSLPIGKLRQMGPGMFPMALGVLLAIFGASIFASALVRDKGVPKADPRAFLAILASLIFFALLIQTLGLFPSLVVTIFIASLAIPGLRILRTLALCVVLMFLTWFIFIFLLSLPIPLIQWRI